VLVAKQAAQVDLLAGGRFRLGVGVGWSPVEYEALGEDFHTRGARYEEQVEVLRLLWTQDVVDFRGRWHTIDRAGILPRPVQRPIPIWMGTRNSELVLRRVGRLADGWISNLRVGAGFEEALAIVRSGAEEAGRDPQGVGIQGVVDVPSEPDLRSVRAQLDALASLGATHASLLTMGFGRRPHDHVDLLSRLGELDLLSP
jgi:probable F420-dependent oxidoreductase